MKDTWFSGGSAVTMALLAVIVVLVLVIWSIKRHRDPILDIECDAPIDELLPSLAGLTLGTVDRGQLGRDLRERRASSTC